MPLHRGHTWWVGLGVLTPRGLPGVCVFGGSGCTRGWSRVYGLGGGTCVVWGGVLALGRHNGVCGLRGGVWFEGVCVHRGMQQGAWFGRGNNAWGAGQQIV